MKILFYGLGAVGAVMAAALERLFEKEGRGVLFAFAVRDEKRARAALFRSPALQAQALFFGFDDEAAASAFAPDVVINAAVPELNVAIARRALALGAHYADMASDIYNETTLQTLRFSQQSLGEAFKKQNRFGLINLGFSPGLTNFIIGEKIAQITALPDAPRIESVRLFLLEELISSRILFSWSPKVALDEVLARPAFVRNGALQTLKPFSLIRPHRFDPDREVETYPVFQEEVISLHDSYPQIDEIRLFCGGNEVELFKNLFQLNLLSRDLKVGSAPVEQVVRKVLPKMKSPKVIEYYNRRRIIKGARFEAVAEIETLSKSGRHTIESVGAAFTHYHDLIGTPFSGATYIAYPTGAAAAVLLFYALKAQSLSGVIAPESLPAALGPALSDRIKRELTGMGIEFHARLSGVRRP